MKSPECCGKKMVLRAATVASTLLAIDKHLYFQCESCGQVRRKAWKGEDE